MGEGLVQQSLFTLIYSMRQAGSTVAAVQTTKLSSRSSHLEAPARNQVLLSAGPCAAALKLPLVAASTREEATIQRLGPMLQQQGPRTGLLRLASNGPLGNDC